MNRAQGGPSTLPELWETGVDLTSTAYLNSTFSRQGTIPGGKKERSRSRVLALPASGYINHPIRSPTGWFLFATVSGP